MTETIRTQVEVFEQPLDNDQIEEVSQDLIELSEKLGLKGQRALFAKNESGEVATRIRWREMTAEENFVYRTLCPVVTDASEYSQSTIPLRVLQVLESAKADSFFKEFQVWDVRSAQIKDPILVGVVRIDWRDKFYILARWGAHLDEMPALIRKALTTFQATRKAKLDELLAKVQQAKADLARYTSIEAVLQTWENGTVDSIYCNGV